MKWLLDSNILVRMTFEKDPQRPAANSAILKLFTEESLVCIVPQNLYEFWTVVTRPVSSNGYGLRSEEAGLEVDTIKEQFELIGDTDAVFHNWESLVRKFRVSGKETHDARLVAAMLAHDIPNILTFNVNDFKRYAGTINAFDPQDVLNEKPV